MPIFDEFHMNVQYLPFHYLSQYLLKVYVVWRELEAEVEHEAADVGDELLVGELVFVELLELGLLRQLDLRTDDQK